MDIIIKKEVRGWVIFGIDTNRAYSRMKPNNDLETIYYPTMKQAKEEAVNLGYTIKGYQKWE